MRIAEKLTNNDQGYGLYMTDVSPENFAVNEKGEVFIIDAENIIVVDKRKIKTGLLFVNSLSAFLFGEGLQGQNHFCDALTFPNVSF